jgi:hypothetical protein
VPGVTGGRETCLKIYKQKVSVQGKLCDVRVKPLPGTLFETFCQPRAEVLTWLCCLLSFQPLKGGLAMPAILTVHVVGKALGDAEMIYTAVVDDTPPLASVKAPDPDITSTPAMLLEVKAATEPAKC